MPRRLPVGAEPCEGGTHFRVWAPHRTHVAVVFERRHRVSLANEGTGYFSGFIPEAHLGARYRFALDDDPTFYPDPASRSQPGGPHGPSMVVDPTRFQWTDQAWMGRSLRESVMYELHVGTWTEEGTFRAAKEQLPSLYELGIRVIDMMPVAEFSGSFGWGYDGVDLYAPYHCYGTPDDLRDFINRAHALGIAVILDVVYNHLGPDGCYLRFFAPEYFTDRYNTEWGDSLNFDGPNKNGVREFVVSNAVYWMDEFHFDGLRIDATQNVYDFGGGEHILAEITRRVRETAAPRQALIIAENEPQRAWLVMPQKDGGYAMDAVLNDDFHHSAVVALTGRNEAYYSDHQGTAQELLSAMKYGFLFQGQRYAWQNQRRGTPTSGIDPSSFIAFLENHDQVANTLDGRRMHSLTSPAKYRAILALVLLGPGTPMLFQGQEFLSSAPFLYFADHSSDLARLVRQGREEFLVQFPSIALETSRARLCDPASRSTFERCKLHHQEHTTHWEMVRALLSLRREDTVISGENRRAFDGAVLRDDAFVLRWSGMTPNDDRLLVVNFGKARRYAAIAEPLIAPPLCMRWRTLFATEDPAWGGRGAPAVEQPDAFMLMAECTTLLAPDTDPDRTFDYVAPQKKRKVE